MNTEQEFQKALELLNACIGSLECEVSLTSQAEFYANSIYYRCEEYRKTYNNSIYGK